MPLGRVISAGMFTMVAKYLESLQCNVGAIVYLIMKPFSAPAIFTHCLHAPLSHLCSRKFSSPQKVSV